MTQVPSQDFTRERLYVFYELFNPQNARNVEQILHEFEGREAVLWRQLAHKYGSNAVQEAAKEHQRRVHLSRAKSEQSHPGTSRVPVAESSWNKSRGAVSLPAMGGFSAFSEVSDSDSRGFSAILKGVAPGHSAASELPGHARGRSSQLLRPFSEVAAHADVVTEISVCLAIPSRMPGAASNEMTSREAISSTATHDAICARRALESLSPASKLHLRDHGGLLNVIEACTPVLGVLGGPSRKANDTFILIDNRIIFELRSALCFRTSRSYEWKQGQEVDQIVHSPSSEAKTRRLPLLQMLQRTSAWSAAQKECAPILDNACRDEDAVLRAIMARMKDEPARAIEELSTRISVHAHPTGVAQTVQKFHSNKFCTPGQAVPRADPYARSTTATLLFDTIQTANPESIGTKPAQWRRLSSVDRRPALMRLRNVVSFAHTLKAISIKQASRLAHWLSAIDKHLAHPEMEHVDGQLKTLTSHMTSNSRVLAGKAVTSFSKSHQTCNSTDVCPSEEDEEVVIVKEHHAKFEDPVEVIDLTLDKSNHVDATGNLSHKDVRPRESSIILTSASRLRKNSSQKKRKIVRFSDRDSKRSKMKDCEAILADARKRGRESSSWLVDQGRILEKRMDRAIWDAFKTAEFDSMLSLLEQGASASYVRVQGGGESALMAAAYHGNEAACRALLARGANAALHDRFGHTASSLARQKKHGVLAALLEGLSDHTSSDVEASSSRAPATALKTKLSSGHTDELSTDLGEKGGATSPSRVPKRRRGDDQHPRSMPRRLSVAEGRPSEGPDSEVDLQSSHENEICIQTALDVAGNEAEIQDKPERPESVT